MRELGVRGGRARGRNERGDLSRAARNDLLVDEAEGIIWKLFQMEGPRAPRALQYRIAAGILAERERLERDGHPRTSGLGYFPARYGRRLTTAGAFASARSAPSSCRRCSMPGSPPVGRGCIDRFLIDVFEEWVRRDVGESIAGVRRRARELGWRAARAVCPQRDLPCGLALALEHTRDLPG
jgi:hypothetical protein